MSKNSSAKCYHDNKERLQKSLWSHSNEEKEKTWKQNENNNENEKEEN